MSITRKTTSTQNLESRSQSYLSIKLLLSLSLFLSLPLTHLAQAQVQLSGDSSVQTCSGASGGSNSSGNSTDGSAPNNPGGYQPVPISVYEPVPPSTASGSPGLFPPSEFEPFPDLVKYECLANNTVCTVFYAIDSNPNVAQDAAMRLCFNFGLPCRPLGCHRLP